MSRKYEVFWKKLLLRVALAAALMTPWLTGMLTLNLALASFGVGLMAGFLFGRWNNLPSPVIRRIDSRKESGK